MIGASAQECSAFSPMVPFLKTIRLKDLSNHLDDKKRRVKTFSLFMYELHPASSFNNQKQNTSFISAPPVVAFSVEEGLSIFVQRLDRVVCLEALLGVIKGYEEGCLLNDVQRLLVLTADEEGFTCLGPRGPAQCQITGRSQAMPHSR